MRSKPPPRRSGSGTRNGIGKKRLRRKALDVRVKIHEYQGKEIFRKFGVPTPRGFPAFSVEEAVEAAKKLGGKVWVVKAQIHAGGRGKGGGVKLAKSLEEVRDF